MKNILYFMHVPWGWIKQRPHFLAEGLSENNFVKVICEKNKERNFENNPNNKNIKIVNYFDFSFKKNKITYIISFLIRKFLIKRYIKKADIIWLTYPSQYNYIKNVVKPNQRIIYDCMDDMIEFFKDEDVIANLKKIEKEICLKSDKIICSSEYLKNKLIKRYNLEDKITVINNAIKKIENNTEKVTLPQEILKIFETKSTKVIYIGTISKWFNFNLIIKTLKEVPNLEFIIIGPSDTEIPLHENLIKINAIEHKYVFELMKLSDYLIMPFIINELIKSVNPVKIYEYIYSNKPSIIPEYEETKKFSEFVYLYQTDEEFIELVKLAVEKKLVSKKTDIENFNFTNENTWDARMTQINELINEF